MKSEDPKDYGGSKSLAGIAVFVNAVSAGQSDKAASQAMVDAFKRWECLPSGRYSSSPSKDRR